MYILNKRTNNIQECSNKDVIKACKKDAEQFEVAATMEELTTGATSHAQEDENEEKSAKEDKTSSEDLEAQKGADKEAKTGAENTASVAGKETEDDLNEKSVADLRAIAKEKGIQGYGNMNKGTLVAVIMAH